MNPVSADQPETATPERQFHQTAAPDATWEVEVFYDGDCPLCRREVDMLKMFDRRNRIRATDIATEGFDPLPLGRSWQELMEEIHGRLPDGSWIKGVEVFRRLYSAVGFRPLIWITRWPLISQGLDLAYRLFAKNRLRMTGRCDQNCSIDRETAGE